MTSLHWSFVVCSCENIGSSIIPYYGSGTSTHRIVTFKSTADAMKSFHWSFVVGSCENIGSSIIPYYGSGTSTHRIVTFKSTAGPSGVTATKMLTSYHAENILSPSSTCSRSKFLLLSYLRKSASGYSKKHRPYYCFLYVTFSSINSYRKMESSVRSMADGSSNSDPSESSMNNGTRLVRAIRSFQAKLSTRIKELRKGLSMKILFFLVGFYCATAFATVIGQTGDWDILSAGLAVVVVEGIGALMYRASFRFLDRVKGLITMFNYWKAGLSLGLFLDSFKYEMDMLLESCNLFGFDVDAFPIFW